MRLPGVQGAPVIRRFIGLCLLLAIARHYRKEI
jgi:hypothetical protein